MPTSSHQCKHSSRVATLVWCWLFIYPQCRWAATKANTASPSRRGWGPIGIAGAAAARSAAAWCIYGFSRPFIRGRSRCFRVWLLELLTARPANEPAAMSAAPVRAAANGKGGAGDAGAGAQRKPHGDGAQRRRRSAWAAPWPGWDAERGAASDSTAAHRAVRSGPNLTERSEHTV